MSTIASFVRRHSRAYPLTGKPGWRSKKDDVAYANACRLERRPGVRERIKFLSHQDEELIAGKRRRIEEALWSIYEAAIGDYLETTEIDGKTLERPKHISALPREFNKISRR